MQKEDLLNNPANKIFSIIKKQALTVVKMKIIKNAKEIK